MKRIQSNDMVVVITGSSAGHVGKVLSVKGNRVIVEGAGIVKKHVKPNQKLNQRGEIMDKESSIDISNVAMLNPKSNKAGKVGFRYVEENGVSRKVRYFKSNNAVIDLV
ncbi:MAG: 50S ribosomal protein L24 [Legionellales bacterium RIFCSPHIGHO2_12_FULL_42_9]|nr:MAG: 50S ribosomal protein L24 [Legionellales bacterium RIFCSPHIGHO2_12_FULL_42_9]